MAKRLRVAAELADVLARFKKSALAQEARAHPERFRMGTRNNLRITQAKAYQRSKRRR